MHYFPSVTRKFTIAYLSSVHAYLCKPIHASALCAPWPYNNTSGYAPELTPILLLLMIQTLSMEVHDELYDYPEGS